MVNKSDMLDIHYLNDILYAQHSIIDINTL